MSRYCKCPVALPYGTMGWSAVCNCGISWSYSVNFGMNMMFILLNEVKKTITGFCRTNMIVYSSQSSTGHVLPRYTEQKIREPSHFEVCFLFYT